MKRLYIIMCMLLVSLGCLTAQADELTCTSFTLSPGGSTQVDVGVSTGSSYTAFLLDITVPAGIEVTAATTALATHTVGLARQQDGKYRVLGYANDNATFNGDNLVRLTVAASDRMEAGSYNMAIDAMLTPDDVTDVQDVAVSRSVPFSVSDYQATAAAPVITFADGKVSIASNTAGATIRYTLDGNEPDDHSAIYTAPVAINHNLTVKAYAVAAGMKASATTAYAVTQFLAATPVISIADHVCTISCATEGAEIRYSISGNDPAASGMKYAGPFTLTSNCTVKAVAMHPDYANSVVGEATEESYVTAMPVIAFNKDKMTLSCTTSGSKIYYTTDGTEPTAASSYYQSAVTLYGNHTVKAIAVREGYNDSPVATAALDYFKVATPVISIENGERCTITCSTADSRIYYCITGNPNAPFDRSSATLYENVIPLDDNCFVQAVAERDLYNTSDVAVKGVYTYGNNVSLNDLTLTGEERDDLEIALNSKTVFSAIQLVIDLPAGLQLDGDTPVELSAGRKDDHTVAWHQGQDGKVKVIIYSASSQNLRGTEGTLLTLHVLCDNAAASGQKDITVSDVVCTTADGVDYFLDTATATFTKDGYTQTVAAPVINVNGDHVSISTTTAGASIYYTLDGSYPNTATSARYTSMFILDGNATIRAIAACEDMNMSPMAETTVSSLRIATPVLKMLGNDSFTLTTATRGAEIHYTLDGSEPTRQSPLYSGLVTLTQNSVVRAKAFKDRWLDSYELTHNIQSLGQYVYADKVYISLDGETGSVPVRLSSDEEYVAYQMDITLPAGIVLDDIVIGRSDGYCLNYAQQANGDYRVLVYDADGTALPSDGGALFTMTIHAADNAAAGDVEIGISHIVMSRADGTDNELGDNGINVTISAQSLNIAAEEFNTLKAFSTAMSGSGWTDPWDTSSDMILAESWPGVTFEDGHVVAIDLSDQGLTGTLPAAIFTLPRLRSLNLSGNHISGCVDEVMANASNEALESLNLSGNELTGDVYALSQALPNLTSLLLGSNRFESVSHALPQTIALLDLSYQTISTSIESTLHNLQTTDRDLMPSIVTYNHAQQNFLNLDLTLTSSSNAEWKASMKHGSGQLSCTFSGTLNEYKAAKGAEVLMRSQNGLSYGSTFVASLDYEMGDATFDDAVNIQDLQTILNYSNGIYPTGKSLFNRAASNLFADERINVQDIVLLVDMLLSNAPAASSVKALAACEDESPVMGRVFIDGDELVIETSEPVAALAVAMTGVDARQVFWSLDGYGFKAGARNGGQGCRAVIYSMAGNELPAGRTVLARLRGGTADAAVTAVEATDRQATVMRIEAQGEATGIAPSAGSKVQGPAYNLGGQRVNKNHKGIKITNGIKYAGK